MATRPSACRLADPHPPELSLNNLKVRELGIVGPDPRSGTNRFDDHAGLQEAFVEVKLHDLGPNYDFISARAGIQQFNADFRGFLFVDEQPALRIFGIFTATASNTISPTSISSKKNTNSGLNTFDRRHQQALLGNVYLQDFFFSRLHGGICRRLEQGRSQLAL